MASFSLKKVPGYGQTLTYTSLFYPSDKDISNDTKLNILTFNLGTHIQLNQVKGSEAPMVSKCHLKYGSDLHVCGLSQCSFNAADFIKEQDCDLIGLQECVNSSMDTFLEIINSGNRQYEILGEDSVRILYDVNKVGNGYILSDPDHHILEPSRKMLVVWFPTCSVLMVNLHAPHDFDSKNEIERAFAQVGIDNFIDTTKIKRIIVTGDFNDSYRKPLENLEFVNRSLKQHKTSDNRKLYTCCDDADYKWMGDYIFDSEYSRNGYYGIPEGYDKELMSDHHPVIYKEY